MKDPRPLLYNLLFLGFLGLLGYGLLTTPQWDWPRLVVAIVAAGFVALLGNMDRLESFKAGAGGIEAKTREVVQKAESAIAELQLLGTGAVAAIFELIDAGSDWGGLPAKERDARKAELLEILKRLGVSPDERQALVKASSRRDLHEYMTALTVPPRAGIAGTEEWREAWMPYGYHAPPTPEDMQRILAHLPEVEPWRDEMAKDYAHYFRTEQHRRPEAWANRDHWYDWSKGNQWPSALLTGSAVRAMT